MATRKNIRKQSPRTRAPRPVNEDMAAFEKQFRAVSQVVAMLPDDPTPEAVDDVVNRWCLGRVLDAVGNDEDLMCKAAPALEALSEDPLSDTAHTFLDQLCSRLPNPGLAH